MRGTSWPAAAWENDRRSSRMPPHQLALTLALALPSDTAVVLDRDDVSVESIAYDAAGARFFAGDLARGKLLEFDRRGRSRVWFEVPGYSVVGIKLAGGRLWACVASSDSTARNRARSALIAIDLATARRAGRWAPH